MNKKMLSIAIGSSLIASVSAGNANASENPFGMDELDRGYQVAMSIMPEGSCGEKGTEGKCGEGSKPAEGKCGEKTPEAKCGSTY